MTHAGQGSGSAAGQPSRLSAMLSAVVVPGVVLALVWLVFRSALDAQFLFFDDDQVVTGNRAFRGFDRSHLEWMFRASHLGHYQPLTWLSYAADHALYGLEARAFHRTNVLLHGLCAVAFYAFARQLLRRALPGRETALAAGAAALLFALHPLRAESVAWVTERRDVLSGLFLMLGLGAWMRWVPGGPRVARSPAASPVNELGALALALAALSFFFTSVEFERSAQLVFRGLGPTGLALAGLCVVACAVAALRVPRGEPDASEPSAGRRRWYWIALLCFLLSLLSKAWGIVIPAVLLVLDVWPLGRLGRPAGRGWAPRTVAALVAEKLPFICLSGIFAALAAWAQATQIDTLKGLGDHTLSERIAQAAYGLAWYPWKTLVPTGLIAIYELPEALPMTEARFLAPLIAIVLATVALVLARRRAPGLLAAWVVFVVVVSPVLGFAQSGPQLVADRYSYLSCMPFALLAGSALLVLRPRPIVAGGLVLACVGYGLLGHRQVGYWHDSETLWEHALGERPESSIARLMRAGDYQRRAVAELDPQRSLAGLERARALFEAGYESEDDPHFASGLAAVHGSLARLDPERAPEHLARATVLAREALERAHKSGSFTPHYRLAYGTALWNEGHSEQALGHFAWFARAQPEHVGGLLNFGHALAALGRPGAARGPLERAVQLDPGQVAGWRELAGVYDALDEPGLATGARARVAVLGG